jgi:hypothetical protein
MALDWASIALDWPSVALDWPSTCPGCPAVQAALDCRRQFNALRLWGDLLRANAWPFVPSKAIKLWSDHTKHLRWARTILLKGQSSPQHRKALAQDEGPADLPVDLPVESPDSPKAVSAMSAISAAPAAPAAPLEAPAQANGTSASAGGVAAQPPMSPSESARSDASRDASRDVSEGKKRRWRWSSRRSEKPSGKPSSTALSSSLIPPADPAVRVRRSGCFGSMSGGSGGEVAEFAEVARERANSAPLYTMEAHRPPLLARGEPSNVHAWLRGRQMLLLFGGRYRARISVYIGMCERSATSTRIYPAASTAEPISRFHSRAHQSMSVIMGVIMSIIRHRVALSC